MKSSRVQSLQALLLCSAAGASLLAAGPAAAQAAINIEPQPLVSALNAFGVQTGQPVISTPELTASKTSPGVQGADDPAIALTQLLAGTGLSYRCSGDTYLIVPGPQAGPAPTRCVVQGGAGASSDGAEGTVEALIVTAQKREEDIQDVPIAISAFTQKDLDAQKLEGGFDLLKVIPNVTFSKNNFTSYNFSIRGVGTKAISATTDPGVAVSFNNTSLIQNRLFEQEYFDIERVEVLRGPQGTLYGRNATGGVINVLSALPRFDGFAGEIDLEVGNYNSRRLRGFVNIPLVDDRLALRLAGSATSREGYGYNDATDNDIDGRDLWSGRISVSFHPTSSIRANLIWEHFSEDDNRARTSKQLCHKDAGPDSIGSEPVIDSLQRALFSTGCKAGSLYDPAALDTPNGLALPFVFAPLGLAGAGRDFRDIGLGFPPAKTDDDRNLTIIGPVDPYEGVFQNRDLRTISSLRDPIYRAEADVIQLNVEADVGETLTLFSQTAYNEDTVYSTQDFNRFNTRPIFNDTSGWNWNGGPSAWRGLAPGGVFCDPQLGCSSSMVGQDISTATGTQFTQELRLQSDFEGPVNFSVGANYTRFEAEANYYVMYNLLTILAALPPLNQQWDHTKCARDGFSGDFTLVDVDDPSIPPLSRCIYTDPNPLESINGEGHNYFRSRNPYELDSYAIFGELYWQLQPDLKLTLGLRYTDDRKSFTPVPTQVLLSSLGLVGGGTVYRGYPEDPAINQRWKEPTGRLVLDWKPDLAFTDDTLVYASVARGYKGGGANPPGIGFGTQTLAEQFGIPPGTSPEFDVPPLMLTANNYPATFEPEFVNAFEIGSKNTLLGGALMLNATAFYYDYKDYQVSKIVDRTAVNENFDAEVWGIEFETVFSPVRDLLINANFGLLDTQIGAGARSIDLMDRTQGDPDWVVVKPWFQLPSNCVVPREVVETFLAANNSFELGGYVNAYGGLCGGSIVGNLGSFMYLPAGYDPADNPNGGAGLFADLKGNDLPNSPHWTFNIGAQYGFDFLDGWRATVRGDYYRQGDSYHRVYNTEYDKLKGWENLNIRLTLVREADDLEFEAYVKNVFDDDPITDAFLNSDDSGLTTNVFVLDPRLIGVSIRKGF